MTRLSAYDASEAVADERPAPLTKHLIESARCIRYADLPEAVVAVAKHCVLDWFAVALAGSRAPAASLLREELVIPGTTGPATLLGGGSTSDRDAALLNGTAGHALDFDDVVWAMMGHPTVPLLPAVLAVAESVDGSGRDLLTAFVAGFETECRIGQAVSPGHYDGGFHSTATLGTFGAVAGSARLLDLDVNEWQHAVGIAATTAAGLKSMFGTMCKPMHAGNAASRGVLAARLAQRGFTSAHDALERPQGFGPTHTATFDPAAGMSAYGDPWFVRRVLFKYHAACFLTHSSIEGLLRLKEAHGLVAEAVDEVVLRVAPGHLDVCNILEPRSGLEAKFSLRFTAALALVTGETGEGAFTDDVVADPVFIAIRDRIRVEPVTGQPTHATDVEVRTNDGRMLLSRVDMERPATDIEIDAQERRLISKFRSLVGPLLGQRETEQLLQAILHLEDLPSVRELTALAAKPIGRADEVETHPRGYPRS